MININADEALVKAMSAVDMLWESILIDRDFLSLIKKELDKATKSGNVKEAAMYAEQFHSYIQTANQNAYMTEMLRLRIVEVGILIHATRAKMMGESSTN